jgi:hypothetical protein
MRQIKRILLSIFTWFFWKHFLSGLKFVSGNKTLSASIKEMKEIESVIRRENNLKQEDVITWDNGSATDREIFAKYITLKYFNQIGALLAFFMSVDKKKILEER